MTPKFNIYDRVISQDTNELCIVQGFDIRHDEYHYRVVFKDGTWDFINEKKLIHRDSAYKRYIKLSGLYEK